MVKTIAEIHFFIVELHWIAVERNEKEWKCCNYVKNQLISSIY
jgi:hypothetical protein